MGLFSELKSNRGIHEIAMNECGVLRIDQQRSIGTQGLNGCTCIVIMSPMAIILAHISPRPDATTTAEDLYAGDSHMISKMNEVAETYNACRRFFPAESTACGVFAMFDDEIALPDQQTIALHRLTLLGLDPESHTYTVPVDPEDNVAGTVVAGWIEPGTCNLFIEDQLKVSLEVPQHIREQAYVARPVASPGAPIEEDDDNDGDDGDANVAEDNNAERIRRFVQESVVHVRALMVTGRTRDDSIAAVAQRLAGQMHSTVPQAEALLERYVR